MLPNGILLANGAWRGREHDNTILMYSQVKVFCRESAVYADLIDYVQVIELLQGVRERTGRVWALFGDSAFGLSLFVQLMLR